MDQRIIDLYDDFTHSRIDRRVFLGRLAELAGGTAAAAALVPLLQASKAKAAMVAADDPRLEVQTVTFDGATGPVSGHLAKPAGATGLGAVIVIHENRGLNPHIEDVTRRAALAGFLALGVDLLSPLGGTPDDEDRARDLIGQLDAADTIANLRAAVAWLKAHPDGNGRVGSVGFCWGGGMSGRLATAEPELNAAVVYYGAVPPLEEVGNIRAELLLNYAEMDARINERVPAFEEALEAAGVAHEVHIYPGTQHAFNNDTSEARYDRAAAELAWSRTIALFERVLGG
jgi:carboxymethylenebutenolidase